MKRFLDALVAGIFAVMIYEAGTWLVWLFVPVGLSVAVKIVAYIAIGWLMARYYPAWVNLAIFLVMPVVAECAPWVVGTTRFFIPQLTGIRMLLVWVSVPLGYWLFRLRPLPTLAFTVGWLVLAYASVYAYAPGMIKKPDTHFADLTGKPFAAFLKNTQLRTRHQAAVSPAIFANKVTLVAFYHSADTLSRNKEYALHYLANTFKGKDVQVLYVDAGKRDTWADFLTQDTTAHRIYDTHSYLMQNMNVQGFPFECILDRKGIIRYVHAGYGASDIETLYIQDNTRKLQTLLDEKN